MPNVCGEGMALAASSIGNMESAESTILAAYGIFQGGGARGLAHVGALRAAEEVGFRFYGFAGTSAGAIIAALASVGFKADELFDPAHPEKHVLTRLDSLGSATAFDSVVKILGASDWHAFHRLRSWGRELAADRQWWRRLRYYGTSGAAALVPVIWKLFWRRGLFSTDAIARVVNELLHRRLVENYAANEKLTGQRLPKTFGRVIRFRDVNGTVPNCTALKIIVTDLARNRLVVFSSADTPDVPIGKAVAASVAVPFLFEPVEVIWRDGDRGRIHVDGGLASNLPVWVFGEEKAAAERVLDTYSRTTGENRRMVTLGFAFREAEGAPPYDFSLAELFRRAMSSMLSTGQSVVRDFVPDLEILATPCALSMFDFDAGLDDVSNAIEAARRFTSERLRYRFVIRPRFVLDALLVLRRNAQAQLERHGLPGGVVRIAAIEPVRSRYQRADPLHFRVTETCGFDDDADDRLLLDCKNSAAPRAFIEKTPSIWPELRSDNQGWRDLLYAEPMTKYERALVRPSLRNILSIPVFAEPSDWLKPTASRPRPIGVVAIDSDQDCRNLFRRAEFLDFMVQESGALVGIFSKTGDGESWQKP